jgi:hypothetical protein
LTATQVGFALRELARTKKNKGFLIPIDQNQPTR